MNRRRCTTFLLTLMAICISGHGMSQTFDEYLALRKKYKITQAAGVEALEVFVGSRVIEIKGSVKGYSKVQDQMLIMLEKSDGTNLHVRSSFLPEWFLHGEVAARLLVFAEKQNEYEEIKVKLISATPESQIAAYEQRLAQSVKKPAPPVASRSKTGLSGVIGSGKYSLNKSYTSDEVVRAYASFIKGRNKKLSDKQAYEIAHGIVGYSNRYGVDSRLILAMVMTESGFKPEATSYAGAQGLGQLMPGTAASLGINNPYDTYQNLYGTVRTIRGHLERQGKKSTDDFDTLIRALAAYNAGSGNVRKYNGVPPFTQTQNYIKKVISLYRAFLGQS